MLQQTLSQNGFSPTARRVIQLKSINQAGQVPPLYLHLDSATGLPLVLGTGRSAVVFLATTAEDPSNPANDYRAVKFLRDDVDKQYAAAQAERFFQEAGQAQRFDMQQGSFVKYYGWGAIGTPDEGQFWWRAQFSRHAQQISNTDDELLRIRRHFDLQGPFYVLDLCQGTLQDLLDKSVPWSELPAYSVPKYRSSIVGETTGIESDIAEVVSRYLRKSPAGLSGYEILNAFRTDDSPAGQAANRIRNFAILEMFAEIVDSVAKLHSKKSNTEPLAHRDLKPGNIFFEHSAYEQSLDQVRIKLSDLGYVTTPSGIVSGDQTLIAGRKGQEYLAPGSQFYRAPEQAELPIEVRVDADPNDPTVVRIKGSKLSDIQIHDWLSLSDLFSDDGRDTREDAGIFKILDVAYDPENSVYRLKLAAPVTTSRRNDLQGQITRATGFHTDGFSLGAILYDLISGGRNPELFYTYCLASFTNQHQRGARYSIDDVVEVLSPQGAQSHAGERLGMQERMRATTLAWTAADLDALLSEIQEAMIAERGVAAGAALDLRERLKHFRFRNFEIVRELLTDKRGVPIPRDVLDVIVRAMLRDVEGSYYMRDAQNAFLSDRNYEAASVMHRRVQELLGQEQYQLPKEGFPRSLQANLLFKLRALTPIERELNA